MSQFGSHSVMGWNIRFLQSQFGMSCNQVMHTRNRLCMEDIHVEHKRVGLEGLSKNECNTNYNS